MSRKIVVLAMAATAILAVGQVGRAEVVMGESVEFPHAGIALALPAGYRIQAVSQPFDVMRAILSEGGQPVQAVTLTALPLTDPSATAEDLANAMVTEQQQNLAIRNLQVLSEAPMKVADLLGAARLISYTFRGDQTVAASVVFCRDLISGSPASKPAPSLPEGGMSTSKPAELSDTNRLHYVITIEAQASRKAEVLPTLGEVVKSVRLLTVARPIDIPLKGPGHLVEAANGLVALHVPHGWFAQMDPAGVTVGQTDYTLGGEAGLSAYVLVSDIPAETSLSQHAQQCVQMAFQAATQQGMEGKVLSQSTSHLGAAEACQLIFEQRPPTTSSAPASLPAMAAPVPELTPVPTTTAAAPEPIPVSPVEPPAVSPVEPSNVVIVQRSAMLPPVAANRPTSTSPVKSQRCLSLVLVCIDARPAAAEAVMEKLADGLVIRTAVKAASPPTTTAPTAGTLTTN